MLVFSHELSEVVCEAFAALTKEIPAEVREEILEELGDTEADTFAFDTEVLRRSAFLFTTYWLDDALARILDPRVPELRNSDGDEILFTTVRLMLKPPSIATPSMRP